MNNFYKVPVSLTKAHLEKLFEGKNAQLKHNHVSGNKHHLYLHEPNAMKLNNAMNSGRGCGLKLNQHEMEANGEGIKEFFQNLGKKVSKVAKQVAPKLKEGYAFYQKNIKPIASPYIRKGLVAALSAGEAALSIAQPELAVPLAALGSKNDDIVNLIGDKSGAFGLHMVNLHLTQAQVKKLAQGKVIQLKHHQLLQGGPHALHLHGHNAKKIHSALKRQKGVRLSLSDVEREHSGEGLKSAYEKVKKVYNKHLKSTVGPHARKAVQRGLKQGFEKLGEKLPKHKAELKYLEEKVSPYLEEQIGHISGAYGLQASDVIYESQKGPPAQLGVPVGSSLRNIRYVHNGGSFLPG